MHRTLRKSTAYKSYWILKSWKLRTGNGLASSAAMAQANPPCWGYWQAGLPAMKALSDETVRLRKSLQTGDSDGEADGRFISQMKLRESAVKSGGERTRLAIASAFSKHAPLLFADEPTTNLDMEGVEMLEKMMAGYRGAQFLNDIP